MTYKRAGRPSYYFEAKLRNGYRQLCADTSDWATARRIEGMWVALADERAWDLLEPVVAELSRRKGDRRYSIGALYDLWRETKQDVGAMRRRLNDQNIEPLVAEWHRWHVGRVELDTAEHALYHVRQFFPEETPRTASSVTVDWLTSSLTRYPGGRNTRRKVHSSLSSFFAYLAFVKHIFEVSPMTRVDRPPTELAPRQFYDDTTVLRIVRAQPTIERAAFFALVYGTGADVSPAVALEKGDIHSTRKEIRIRGTKTSMRDRLVRVNDSLWPVFWRHAKTVISGYVFPGRDRFIVSDWHRQTVGDGTKDTHSNVVMPGLRLKMRLPLRCARHHFAVRLLQAGAPIQVVAQQLGSDARTVLKHYGPWVTSAEDRAHWEEQAGKNARRLQLR